MSDISWTEKFTPAEREAAADIVSVAFSIDWVVMSFSGLSAICLLIFAGNRSKQGDTLGAILSAIAAILFAIAPIIAKNLFNGGLQ